MLHNRARIEKCSIRQTCCYLEMRTNIKGLDGTEGVVSQTYFNFYFQIPFLFCSAWTHLLGQKSFKFLLTKQSWYKNQTNRKLKNITTKSKACGYNGNCYKHLRRRHEFKNAPFITVLLIITHHSINLNRQHVNQVTQPGDSF